MPEIAVGRDGRLSGPWLRDALIEGIRRTGVNVVDIGQVATPMLYFATIHLGTGSGVEITGSHNPPEYNGLKIMLAGEALYGDGLQRLYRRIVEADSSRLRRRACCVASTFASPTWIVSWAASTSRGPCGWSSIAATA